MQYTQKYKSPVGELTLLATDDALVGLWLGGQKYHGNVANIPVGDNDVLNRVVRWLDAYFAGHAAQIDFRIAPRGTEFQRRVWHALCEIPHGQTRTYGEIASRIGCNAPRAVGVAIGHNPISIIIPCHRVIGANGQMTGYAGGIHNKEILLKTEQGIIPAK